MPSLFLLFPHLPQRFPLTLTKSPCISRFLLVNAEPLPPCPTPTRTAGYPKPKLSELELEASLSLPPPATSGGKHEGRLKGDAESQAKPSLAGGGEADGGLDRSGLKSSGRLRTGMLARSDVESFTVCFKQITAVCRVLLWQHYLYFYMFGSGSKQLGIKATAHRRVRAGRRDW
jgi:hypothetical protein